MLSVCAENTLGGTSSAGSAVTGMGAGSPVALATVGGGWPAEVVRWVATEVATVAPTGTATGTGRWLADCSSAALTILISGDRKSTRLNSSHVAISYAVFCLKKIKTNNNCQSMTPEV